MYHTFMTSPLWLVLSLYKEDYICIYKFLNVCPFDYTVVVVSGKVELSLTGLHHQWGGCCYSYWPCLVGLQPLCNRIFGGDFCVIALLFGFFCGCRGISHITESVLFLFLSFKSDHYQIMHIT